MSERNWEAAEAERQKGREAERQQMGGHLFTQSEQTPSLCML